jgi:hypothetical protein
MAFERFKHRVLDPETEHVDQEDADREMMARDAARQNHGSDAEFEQICAEQAVLDRRLGRPQHASGQASVERLGPPLLCHHLIPPLRFPRALHRAIFTAMADLLE